MKVRAKIAETLLALLDKEPSIEIHDGGPNAIQEDHARFCVCLGTGDYVDMSRHGVTLLEALQRALEVGDEQTP